MTSPQNPKLLIVGPYPPPFAGPEMAIKALLESPISETCLVEHLSTNVRRDNASKGKPGLGLVVAFFRFTSRLVKRLFQFRPDAVYFFVTATRMGWLGRDIWCIALCRLFGARVITHMRAGHFQNNLRKAKRIELSLIRWACHRVSWSLVQSESLRGQFAGLAPDERVVVLHNMIDTQRYGATDLGKFDRNTILYLGHLSEAKGYCEMLRAIPEVAALHPDVVFEFAGAKIEQERNVFHDQATGNPLPGESPEDCFQTNIAGRFERNYKYLGVLDEDAKIAALSKCSFLVLPSYSEGFSMAILEAITMGKPVVCTAVGAMQDILKTGEHGEIIAPGDTQALIHGIRRLLESPQYRDETSGRNASYARRNFSQRVIAERLVELVGSAIGRS